MSMLICAHAHARTYRSLCMFLNLQRFKFSDVDAIKRKVSKDTKGSSCGLPNLPCSSHKIPSSTTLQGIILISTIQLTIVVNLLDIIYPKSQTFMLNGPKELMGQREKETSSSNSHIFLGHLTGPTWICVFIFDRLRF